MVEIRIREVVVELLQNPYIDITYVEHKGDGFDLSVRVKDDIHNNFIVNDTAIKGGK